MRNIVIYLFIGLGLWSCNKTKSTSFTIEGLIEGDFKDSTEISISYLTQNNGIWEEVEHTSYSKNNKFHFEGNINELTAACLFYDDVEIPIYLEPVVMKLVIDKNNPYAYKLSGTSVEKESIELRNILSVDMNTRYQIANSVQEIFNEISLYDNYPKLADSLMQKVYQYKAELMISAERIVSLQLDFINKHNSSQIVPHLLYLLARDNELVSIDTVAAIYNGLPEHTKATLLGRLAADYIKLVNRRDISIGDMAPDFSRESIQGDIISLSDFIGRSYILLDFWASWCAPCIKGIPDIKNIHDKYNKNLKIIAISSDSNREDWLNAINKYQLGMWTQILSVEALNNSYFRQETDLAVIYGANAIPLYILIDEQGKIIAKWNHIGEEQLIEIDEILTNQFHVP